MSEIEHWDAASDGPLAESVLRHKLEAHGYVVPRYIYSPGTRFPVHGHDCDNLDAVLAGRFRLVMADTAVVLEAGDCLQVPKGVEHSAEVICVKRPVHTSYYTRTAITLLASHS